MKKIQLGCLSFIGLSVLFIILFIRSGNKMRDIYDLYPVGKILNKVDLKDMRAIYMTDGKRVAMKVDLGQLRHKDFSMYHILFFDNTLAVEGTSYFPLKVDSLKNYTIFARYTDETWEERRNDYRNDIPDIYKISSSYDDGYGHSDLLDLLLDSMNLDKLPDIILYVKRSLIPSDNPDNFTIADTLTLSCNQLEFFIPKRPKPNGMKTGRIEFDYYEEGVCKLAHIDIYGTDIVNKFFDDLWKKLQERKEEKE
jgi:hypothetical protein